MSCHEGGSWVRGPLGPVSSCFLFLEFYLCSQSTRRSNPTTGVSWRGVLVGGPVAFCLLNSTYELSWRGVLGQGSFGPRLQLLSVCWILPPDPPRKSCSQPGGPIQRNFWSGVWTFSSVGVPGSTIHHASSITIHHHSFIIHHTYVYTYVRTCIIHNSSWFIIHHDSSSSIIIH